MSRLFSTRVVKRDHRAPLSHKRHYAPLINSPIVVLVDGNEARKIGDRIRAEVGREINSSRLKAGSISSEFDFPPPISFLD